MHLSKVFVFAATIVSVMTGAGRADTQRILCYGDSITAGGTWVETVGKHHSIEAINAGRGGRKAAQAKEELVRYLEQHADLDRIILFLGVNDLPARDRRPGDVKVAACVKNMSDAVDLALRYFAPRDIILAAPCGVNAESMSQINIEKGYHIVPPLLAKLEAEYEALARQNGVSFLSLLHVVGKEHYRDGLHPNDAGDREIAQAVLGFLTAHETSQHGRVLLRENFDAETEKGFADKLLSHRHIRLARGAGPDGSDAIRVAYVGYDQGSERVVVRHPLGDAVSRATLAFDVCFGEDFQWTRGGKLHGLGPRHPITGGRQRQAEGWSARIMFKSEGRCATYLYDQDKQKKWGVGRTTDKPVFVAEQWRHVVLEVRLNDPGRPNGHARIWIDGREVMHSEGVVFRDKGGRDTLIQALLFSTFHGGNTPLWTPVDDKGEPATVYATFDNFLVTTGEPSDQGP